jgi:photosystem II stability/assembly factor-like uncharacterized protein
VWRSRPVQRRNFARAAIAGVVLAGVMVGGAHAQIDKVEERLDTSLRLLRRQHTDANRRASRPDILRRLRGDSGDVAEPVLPVLIKHTGDASQLEAAGFCVQARLGTIFTGTVSRASLEDVAAVPGVRFVQSSQKAFAHGAVAPRDAMPARTQPHPQADPLFSGTGVLIASIDTGVDIFHHDFRHDDGTTRIKYLLDFSSPGDADGNGALDGTGPFGGTLYTEAQINAVLASGGSAQRDTTGHGTHGLSIAAGDDTTLPGIAPGADLIVVKATRVDGGLSFETVDVINALAFVDQKAAELTRPYVVNLSLGTIMSSHDGRSLEEQAIDTLFGPGRPGKAAVVAAGNSSEHRTTRFHHFGGTAHVGLSQTHTFVVPSYTPTSGRGNDRVVIELWYRGRDKHRITVTPPDAAPVFASYGTYVDLATAKGNVFIANLGGVNPENGDVQAILVIDDWEGTPPAAGTWTITITAEDIGENGEYHAWLADDSIVGSMHPYFTGNADNAFLVGKPGSAFHAITVGSYAQHDPATRFRTSWTDVNGAARMDSTAVADDLSEFSSAGSTRDGRLKPELTAPGERVLGAVSQDAWPGVAPGSVYRFHPFADVEALLTQRTASRAFGVLQGTSFAAPVVTGLVARILSQNSALDAVQIRAILTNAASVDTFTGAVPNVRWGYGKASLLIGTTPSLPSHVLVKTHALPTAVPGMPYGQVLAAEGGQLPYSWMRTSGTLPPGLTLNGSGLISGTATTLGNYTFTVQVSDGSLPAVSATRGLTIIVSDTTPLVVATHALPPAYIGSAYDSLLEATGGQPPYTWTVAGGTLPAGLSLAANGRVTGRTSALGGYSFTIRVQDATSAFTLRSVRMKVTGNTGAMWDPLGDTWTEVAMLAVDPSDSNHVVSYTTGFFDDHLKVIMESRDGGQSWKPISINNGFGGQEDQEATELTISPSGVPWAARGSGVAGQGAVMRYDAATSTWITVRNDCGDSTAIDFDNAGGVYLLCGSSKTFRKSVDQGQTWTNVGTLCGGEPLFGGGIFGYLTVSRSNPSRMYALRLSADGWQSCHSSNGGMTWTLNGTSPTSGFGSYRDIHVSSTDPLDVVRAVNQTSIIERSVDGGLTWTEIDSWLSYTLLARSYSDPATLLIARDGNEAPISRSTDFGETWTYIQIPGLPSSFEPIRSIAIDPHDSNTFYVGTTVGALYTSDGGATWTARNHNLLVHPTSGIAISPSRPDDLMLTTPSSGAYLSRTGGQKWTAINNLHLIHFGGPRISATDPTLYYARHDLPMRSTDYGLTWMELLPCPAECPSTISAIYHDAFDIDDSGNTLLLANGNGEILRSMNSGDSWTQIGTVSTFASRVVDFTFAHDLPNRVYAALEDSNSSVRRSEDAGLTWTPYGNAPAPQRVFPAPSNSDYLYSLLPLRYFDPEAGTWQIPATAPSGAATTLVVSWTTHLTAYAGMTHPGTGGVGGIWKTTDGGRNWSRMTGVLDSYSVVAIVLHPTKLDTVYAATAENGVLRTDDGGATWTPLDRFGTVGEVVNMTSTNPDGEGMLYAATSGYGVQVWIEGPNIFLPFNVGLTNFNVNAIAFDNTYDAMYAGTAAGIFVAPISGGPWTPTSLNTGFITDFVIHNDGTGTRRIWATVKGQGVALSEDGGNSFTVYSAGLGSLELTSVEVQTGQGARRIWATTRGADGVVYSDDDGRTWKSAAGSGLSNREITDLSIESGTGTRRIWATTSTGVFYSDNNGLSWTELSFGLPSGIEVTSISIDPRSNEALVSLYSDREGGVYRGGNINGVWRAFNEGLEELKVLRLTNDQGRAVGESTFATTFFAATAGDGIYRSELLTSAAPPLSIMTTQPPVAVLREPYAVSLAATGGLPPYRWSITDGFLPAGLSMDPATGTISGSLARIHTAAFTAQVADSTSLVARRTLTIPTEYPTWSVAFSDDPLVEEVSRPRAIHVLELRATVNDLRERAGLPTLQFTDPLIVNVTVIRVIHILELRAALDEARRVLGRQPLVYTPGAFSGGAIRAVHLQELRDGMRLP